jgi:cellulose synthase/poly-beta-1,6-N-acetylglucosamine synthase-like glycosyltransferase
MFIDNKMLGSELMSNFFDTLFRAFASIYPISKNIYSILGTILSVIVIHKAFYFVIGMFFTRKFKPAKKKHKYGIVIAARNEKYVIGNLIDSINKQDYPKDLLTVFVVADNCTDDTADIARKKGAICYERHDPDHRTKGYALEYLFKNIDKDYGIDSFEGYFVFDADNLLKSNYISKMNDAFDSGCKIITSYRNTKNFDENWIASTYALHWIRSIRTNHRARSVLHLATNIQGTGFLFANEIVRNGWHYTSLTEDRAFTVDAVSQGYEITYQDDAVFYDEQPTSFKIAMRQRIRWAKGHLLAFKETGFKLFINIFFGKLFVNKRWGDLDDKNGSKNKFIEFFRHRFASFDTLCQLIPINVVNLVRWIIIYVLFKSFYSYSNGLMNVSLVAGNSWLANIVNAICNLNIIILPGIKALFICMLLEFVSRIIYRMGVNIANMFTALYIFITERKKLPKMSIKNKILSMLTWPIFDIMGRYAMYIACFKKVEWKPIPHNSEVSINDIN